MELDLNLKKSIFKVQKMLEDLNFIRKKVNKIYHYQTTQRVHDLRKKFQETIQDFHPESFVFINESSFDFKIMFIITTLF